MFPIVDWRGKTVGFGARKLADDDHGPKYLNTSENELYHKGEQLFGIDQARGPARQGGPHRSPSRATPTCWRFTRPACARPSRSWARPSPTSSCASWGKRPRRSTSRSTPTPRVRRRWPGPRAAPTNAVWSSASSPSRRAATPPTSSRDDGAEAFGELIEGAISVPQFEVKRSLAVADLTTPGGRDEALSSVVPVIRSVPRNSATWDHLVRYVSDRLAVEPQYLSTLLASAPQTSEASHFGSFNPKVGVPHTPRLPSIEAVASTERAFLAMCLAHGQTGRRYLDGLHDDHFSSPPLRRVRDHLVAHFEDPLADLPDDEALAGLITQVAFLADDQPASESVLRLTWLQLELRRTDRRLRQAAEHADYDRQRALWPEREGLKREIDDLMGQTQ